MAVDVNRFPDFDSGKVRVFICDCFYYLSEVGGETIGKDLEILREQSLQSWFWRIGINSA